MLGMAEHARQRLLSTAAPTAPPPPPHLALERRPAYQCYPALTTSAASGLSRQPAASAGWWSEWAASRGWGCCRMKGPQTCLQQEASQTILTKVDDEVSKCPLPTAAQQRGLPDRSRKTKNRGWHQQAGVALLQSGIPPLHENCKLRTNPNSHKGRQSPVKENTCLQGRTAPWGCWAGAHA
mgnify:CR=1 FL=1